MTFHTLHFLFGVKTSTEWLNLFHCASQVNSDRIYWQKKPDGSLSQIHVEKSSIGQCISTKAVGSDARVDITHLYKYPEGNKQIHLIQNLELPSLKLGNCIPVAQWWSIALAVQRLWVQFPGNTHTDNTRIT